MGNSINSGITGAMILAATTILGNGASAQSLTTLFASNNSYAGNMFNVNVLNRDLYVTGIDVNIENNSSSANIEVWTRAGSYTAGIGTTAGWTQVSSTAVTPAGFDNRTFVDVTDFVLSGGETTGIYVFVTDHNVDMNYTNASSGGIVASNADLEITSGVGVGDPPFGSVFTYRTWNGSIYYTLVQTVPDLSALSQGVSAIARGVVAQAGGVAATKANDGLSLESSTTVSTRGAAATGVNAWFEFTGFVVNGNDLRQTASGFQLGGDMHVTPNLALGLSIGHDQVNSTAGGFDLSGDLTFVQPYLGYVNGQMRAEASLIYGRGDFEQISVGGTGMADTTVVAATVSGAYDFALTEGNTLSPMASLSFGEEESKGTGGTLAGTGTETSTFGRASIGARYATAFDMGTAFVGLHADYDYANGDTNVIAGFDDDTGLAGRIELGLNTNVTDRLNLRTNMSVGGLGTATKDVSAGLTLSMSF